MFLTINDGYLTLEGADPARASTDFLQFIRLIDGPENGKAGREWSRKCPLTAERRNIKTKRSPDHVGADHTTTITLSVEAVYKRSTFTYGFTEMPNPMPADFGLGDNRCQPSRANKDDRGYAILDRDVWWNSNAAAKALRGDYKKQFVAKRDLLMSDDMAALSLNSTMEIEEEEEFSEDQRTAEEIMEEMGLIKCEDRSCKKEMAEYGVESAVIAYAAEQTIPVGIVATSTTVVSSAIATSVESAISSRSYASVDMPAMTPSPSMAGR